ncbi:nitrogenase stabilizing/protective protein NifW [Novosphingobium mangrovi (ex Huang et al. 2023)]|uniref:Nitrogenase-stabilizing/protective protein NifW n=1 Tax=Novosphingobium mangrovi (ex Huang et al. 2023) TaxID=2976432 RepID=A0ABT2I659_9SPHN|nr:nitrogenase stabilizing/protective protein NifW [Novosphingobium mangrovi (ex Huang et al. 2023)]MCT2400300.1 nitrogenase stabilizing/protective protein NifW [Novosphingobium mangrovi (ex Huang et al. 2023)]
MSLLDDLQDLSSAEEFFAFLGVEYEPEVVHVARLHIMRRMGQYLRGSEVEGVLEQADDAALFALCRDHLAQAYADFVASSPIEERVFKVHKEAVEPKPEPNRPFVPLTALTGE